MFCRKIFSSTFQTRTLNKTLMKPLECSRSMILEVSYPHNFLSTDVKLVTFESVAEKGCYVAQLHKDRNDCHLFVFAN